MAASIAAIDFTGFPYPLDDPSGAIAVGNTQRPDRWFNP
jgi:hypothetical protein